MGHVKLKCPSVQGSNTAVNTAVVATETKTSTTIEPSATMESYTPIKISLVKYNCEVTIENTTISAQIDPESSDCLIQASCAVQTEFSFQPTNKRYIGLGVK